MTSLLQQLINAKNKNQRETEVQEAKDSLVSEKTNVVLSGVNAPEFEQDDDSLFSDDSEDLINESLMATGAADQFSEDEWMDRDQIKKPSEFEKRVAEIKAQEAQGAEEVDEQEAAFEQQETSSAFAEFDDLEDADDFYDNQEEDQETKFGDREISDEYLGFSTRTIKALTGAGYETIGQVKGLAKSELRALKGFGPSAMEEVLAILEVEGKSDWVLKRKPKTKEIVEETLDAPLTEEVDVEVTDHQAPEVTGTIEETEYVDPNHIVPEPEPEESLLLQGGDVNVLLKDDQSEEDESEEEEEVASEVRMPRVLLIGCHASGAGRVKTFEEVYDVIVKDIETSNNVPHLSLIDFGKGWAALATCISVAGWPADCDYLQVSHAYANKPEIRMALVGLADCVIA